LDAFLWLRAMSENESIGEIVERLCVVFWKNTTKAKIYLSVDIFVFVFVPLLFTQLHQLADFVALFGVVVVGWWWGSLLDVTSAGPVLETPTSS
jgi:hypothetical protein